MKAVIRRKYGSFDHLRIEETKKPSPSDHEVLIKVFATTVNRTDCAIAIGWPFAMRFFTGLFSPKNLVLGTDFAGQVAAVGKKVTAFSVGQKVFGFQDQGLSSQAEYMVFPEDGAISLIPPNINYIQAVASLEGAHYGINFLNKVKLQARQKAILNGATGAIGSSLLQFLKHHGLEVTAVCGTDNISLIKALGADKIYDYETEDFTKDSDSYDYIFDAVGKSTFPKCKHLLKEKGIYISSELGPYAQNIFFSLTTPIFGRKKVIFPFPSDIKKSILYIEELLEAGQFKPLIDRHYPLEEAIEAYKYVNSGQKIGNVVIDVVQK